MFNFFHLCTHSGINKEREPKIHEITLRNKSQTDVVIEGAYVKEIHEVRVVEYTPRYEKETFNYDDKTKPQIYEDPRPEKGHYDGKDLYYVDYSKFFKEGASISEPLPVELYQSFLHNRIKWNVEPPLVYVVTATIQFNGNDAIQYSGRDCPICDGKGWFVDIFNNQGEFQKDSGIFLVAQRFIKDLLTELESSVINLQYGTTLKQAIATSVVDDEEMFDDIRLIVSGVEDRYILRQQEEYISLETDERLTKAWVRKIERSKRDPRLIVLEIQFETEAETRSIRFMP